MTATVDEWYGWLVAVRRVAGWATDMPWGECFRSEGRKLFFSIPDELLDPDGHMYMGSRSPHGRYQFVESSEVAAAFPEAAWLNLVQPCPWVGDVEGFLNWEWWTDRAETRRDDLERFLGAGKGFAVRLRDGYCWDVIAKNTYRLGAASHKHGFGDGDDLPALGDAYDSYVWGTIAKALAGLGLEAERIAYGTSHNRIRFDQFALRPGQTYEECWKIFRQHENDPLEFWAYNNDREGIAEVIRD